MNGRLAAGALFLVVSAIATGAASPAPARAQSATTLAFTGTAHNLSVDVRSGVTLTVRRSSAGLWTAEGAFDGVSLFGRFEVMPGRDLACGDVTPGSTCILFVGVMQLGDDTSGYDSGTGVGMTIQLVIHGRTASGVYRIGPVAGHDYDQYGTLELTAR